MSTSSELLAQARRVIPGGVNSPVRAFSAVEGDPPFIDRGEGVHLYDVDGNRYIDLVGSWGPLILGHAHPFVVDAVRAAMARGASFGAPTEAEVRFAEDIVAAVPSVEQVRLVSSGTEATMHALRLARGFTGRDAVLKLDGCYHGAHDTVLVSAGSGVATYARPGSPGILAPATLTAPFNDLDAAVARLEAHPVAAVILEPVAGNMGCVAPAPGYLEGLREACTAHGTLLIFDEVMTGFRLALGGAQERFGVTPDLTCLGKIVGGGLPLAAFGGRREIMQRLSPVGPVYQAGTLSGNPLAVAAGRATLQLLREPGFYDHLEHISEGLEARLAGPVARAGASLSRVGSMMTLFFRATPPRRFAEVKECDFERFARFHRACLEEGVYLPCSQYEAAFLPALLTDEDLDQTAAAIARALARSAA
ncbi:MAG: glutamate-1-semialdehyde 2,1-aminomutase [Alphaproteobacteria bacterium]|nr:glutamate-1-semialdehyde 2,1-aminomutase [Alphaproteobacteria bacterium]